MKIDLFAKVCLTAIFVGVCIWTVFARTWREIRYIPRFIWWDIRQEFKFYRRSMRK